MISPVIMSSPSRISLVGYCMNKKQWVKYSKRVQTVRLKGLCLCEQKSISPNSEKYEQQWQKKSFIHDLSRIFTVSKFLRECTCKCCARKWNRGNVWKVACKRKIWCYFMIWSHKMKWMWNVKSSNNQHTVFFPSPFYYCYYLYLSVYRVYSFHCHSLIWH